MRNKHCILYGSKFSYKIKVFFTDAQIEKQKDVPIYKQKLRRLFDPLHEKYEAEWLVQLQVKRILRA